MVTKAIFRKNLFLVTNLFLGEPEPATLLLLSDHKDYQKPSPCVRLRYDERLVAGGIACAWSL